MTIDAFEDTVPPGRRHAPARTGTQGRTASRQRQDLIERAPRPSRPLNCAGPCNKMIKKEAAGGRKMLLLAPNCPGLITPEEIKIGEIGGPDEAEAARWCQANMKKPIVGFIAGVTAPADRRMGHAGALISGGADTADAKLAIMEECGFCRHAQPERDGALAQGAAPAGLR